MIIRATHHDDIAALQEVLNATGLFPADMLPAMLAPFFANDAPAEIWLTCEIDETPVGFCYAVPEQMADGAWNMLAIAVLPARQGAGCGTALLRHLEAHLSAEQQRILIVDTSGTAEFARTRAFYRRNGYGEEARIRDFWAAGDDKVVFRKALT